MSEFTGWEIVRCGGPLDTIIIREAVTSGRYVAEIRPSREDDPDEVSRRARMIEAAPLADLLEELLSFAGEPLIRHEERWRVAADRARQLLNDLAGEL